jgi:hypothetical protein
MTYRPLSDENLVAASALIVIGEVEQVAGARLVGGRIVTQTHLRVDESLKGSVTGRHILISEPGGRVGDVTVRIPGAARFVPGERVLVFLRARGDGTLGTTALSLAKYTIAPATPTLVRRTVPAVDERVLAVFDAQIRSLASGEASRAVATGFGGPRAVEVEVHVDGFTLLGEGGDCDPTAQTGCIGGRWFEARCAEGQVYAMSGADGTLGSVASRQAFDAALAAWSEAPGGFLDLIPGPTVPPVPSALAPTSLADFDGQSIVQFDDPFEIVPDLIGCQGVLALGGTVSTSSGGVVQGTTTFDRVLEGDVVVNQGVGACLSAGGLAETLAHEVGHTLGFGHSSESAAEPDAVKRGALMYFLIHDDGRGAQLGTDDLAGLALSYGPPPSEPTPEAELRRQAACLLQVDLWSSACFVDDEELQGFPAVPLKKFAKAGTLAAKAYGATKVKKQVKLLKKADRQLVKAETKLTALQIDGVLRPECAGPLLDTVSRGRARVEQAQLSLGAGS